ncbi:MAG: ABC transporter ATP-binding protein [Deltaproteobacteria bacterium]|nr:ABC transporter ATP-binding protein [Deltaproteobacteria bacterium]
MIAIRSLVKYFGNRTVLRSVNCEFAPGRVVGIAGPNACGKSTLMKSILGLVIPDKGEIEVSGISARMDSARGEIGYMPQHASYPARLTPRELFELVAALRRKNPTRREELIDRFAVRSFLDSPCGTLSVGTRQKISAIAALMCEPPILILDEPTASFDPVAAYTFKQLVREESKRGSTILIVSHIVSELEQLIDDLVFMLEGRVLFQGSFDALSNLAGTSDLELAIIQLMQGTTHLHSEDTAR